MHILKNIKWNLSFGLILLVSCTAFTNAPPDPIIPTPRDGLEYAWPQHHMHSFGTKLRYHAVYEHALAMGYQLVVHEKPDDPQYADLGVICLTNGSVAPMRFYENTKTGKPFVTYHRHYVNAEGKSAIAAIHGLDRNVQSFYPLTPADLELIKGYGVATEPLDDLTVENITLEKVMKRFETSWPVEDGNYKGTNIGMNFQNRTVVSNAVRAHTEMAEWEKYNALFIDSIAQGGNGIEATNVDWFPGGTYASRREGHSDYLKRLTDYVRDPAKTGHPWPMPVFANIYNPHGEAQIAHGAPVWYARNQFRFDHYYFEKGGLGKQKANGVVPGTTEPAFVNRNEETGEVESYLPARLVALDDVYTWSRLLSRQKDFDHEAFFEQHWDAAVTALTQGSWFGWYGEDAVITRDAQGNMLYPPALQLLRAIPNWENIWQTPVPPFGADLAKQTRRWDGKEYRSAHMRLTRGAIQGQNPFNKEIYAVFLDTRAGVHIPEGWRPDAIHLASRVFAKTNQELSNQCIWNQQDGLLRPANTQLLHKGLRITLAPVE